jgi:hypothetical protein
MSRLLMKLAVALLPPNRKEWGEAMMGEFESAPTAKKQFAIGCLHASLIENFTNVFGLARLGFLVLQAIAIGIMGLWAAGLVVFINDLPPIEDGGAVKIIIWLSIGLLPLHLVFSAHKAACFPTNRFHLAEVGSKMVANFAVILGVFFALQFLTAHVSCYFMPRCAEVGVINNFALFLGGFFLVTGVLSRRDAKSMRKTAAIGFCIMCIFCGPFLAISLLNPQFANIWVPFVAVILPLLLMAVAAAIFIWMQRPASNLSAD